MVVTYAVRGAVTWDFLAILAVCFTAAATVTHDGSAAKPNVLILFADVS